MIVKGLDDERVSAAVLGRGAHRKRQPQNCPDVDVEIRPAGKADRRRVIVATAGFRH